MENKSWLENFRVVTPVLVTIGLFMIAGIKSDVKDINEKLFKHLTNDEIHSPRSMVVSQQAFTLYQTMRDNQMADIKLTLSEIKEILKTKK
jgi:hypothetical protein